MTKTTILITGAAGLSGSLVMNELIKQPITVRALVRDRNQARAWESFSNVAIFEGDMLEPATFAEALDGVARVLLISSANTRMVETQCTFIDACKRAGVAHVVKFSGEESQIGFDPQQFRFTREHGQIETYLEQSGLPWTHLRPSQFMQVYLREAAAIRNKGVLLLPLADIRMSPVDLLDVAQVAATLLSRGGHQSESLHMTGPEALSMAEIAATIAKVTAQPVRYVPISIEERSERLRESGLPSYLVEAIADQSAERRKHPQARVDLSTHQLFGVTPTSFEQIAARHAADFGKRQSIKSN